MDQHFDHRRLVLYVEDHPVNAMLMKALFERRPGLRLVVAASGEHALGLISGLQPALLLLDLNLPDCHGMQLLPLLRLHAPYAPAVAVTSDDDVDLVNSGFCELWPKPIDVAHVLRRLDALTTPELAARPPPSLRSSQPASAPSWA